MTAMGHLRPGPTSGRPANVCYASDRYLNGEPAETDEKNETARAVERCAQDGGWGDRADSGTGRPV